MKVAPPTEASPATELARHTARLSLKSHNSFTKHNSKAGWTNSLSRWSNQLSLNSVSTSSAKPSSTSRAKTPSKSTKTPSKSTKTPSKSTKTPSKLTKTPSKSSGKTTAKSTTKTLAVTSSKPASATVKTPTRSVKSTTLTTSPTSTTSTTSATATISSDCQVPTPSSSSTLTCTSSPCGEEFSPGEMTPIRGYSTMKKCKSVDHVTPHRGTDARRSRRLLNQPQFRENTKEVKVEQVTGSKIANVTTTMRNTAMTGTVKAKLKPKKRWSMSRRKSLLCGIATHTQSPLAAKTPPPLLRRSPRVEQIQKSRTRKVPDKLSELVKDPRDAWKISPRDFTSIPDVYSSFKVPKFDVDDDNSSMLDAVLSTLDRRSLRMKLKLDTETVGKSHENLTDDEKVESEVKHPPKKPLRMQQSPPKKPLRMQESQSKKPLTMQQSPPKEKPPQKRFVSSYSIPQQDGVYSNVASGIKIVGSSFDLKEIPMIDDDKDEEEINTSMNLKTTIMDDNYSKIQEAEEWRKTRSLKRKPTRKASFLLAVESPNMTQVEMTTALTQQNSISHEPMEICEMEVTTNNEKGKKITNTENVEGKKITNKENVEGKKITNKENMEEKKITTPKTANQIAKTTPQAASEKTPETSSSTPQRVISKTTPKTLSNASPKVQSKTPKSKSASELAPLTASQTTRSALRSAVSSSQIDDFKINRPSRKRVVKFEEQPSVEITKKESGGGGTLRRLMSNASLFKRMKKSKSSEKLKGGTRGNENDEMMKDAGRTPRPQRQPTSHFQERLIL